MSINVRDEISHLKKVLLHRPGLELENLVPEFLERLLFDDIPYLKEAQNEHDQFAQILRDNGTKVYYLVDEVVKVLRNEDIKQEFLKKYLDEADISNNLIKKKIYELLNGIKDTKEFVEKTIVGVCKNEITLTEKTLSAMVEEDYPFYIDPMPNLYFTRDPFASVGDGVAINKMYSTTRCRETIYADFIFKYSEEFGGTKRYYDRTNKHHIEGGDILNISQEVVAVGISQRTTKEAIEEFAKTMLFDESCKVKTVLAINLPNSRAYMHLDTVFTQIDYNKFTIHPGINKTLQVFELTTDENGNLDINEVNDELVNILGKHLKRNDIDLIPCGGGEYVAAHREQWNDGSNTLCIKPGHVVVYERNVVTNRLLEDHGLVLYKINGGELVRGRGGPRCMSMPLERA